MRHRPALEVGDLITFKHGHSRRTSPVGLIIGIQENFYPDPPGIRQNRMEVLWSHNSNISEVSYEPENMLMLLANLLI